MDTENTTNSCPPCWGSFVEYYLRYDGFLPFNSGVECACAENAGGGCFQKVPQPILLTSDIASASFNLLVHLYGGGSSHYYDLKEVLYLEIMHRAKKSYVPEHEPQFYLDWVDKHHPSFKWGEMFSCTSQHIHAWTIEAKIDIACKVPVSSSLYWGCPLGVLT